METAAQQSYRGASSAAGIGMLQRSGGAPADTRLCALLGVAAWSRLPADVRRRFSKFIAPGETVEYRGEVVRTGLTVTGRLLATLARAIGGPLPLHDGATGPSRVVVSQHPVTGHQIWLRAYERAGAAPQAVTSQKCFRGPTGLEEHVGGGFGMALAVTEEAGALVFRSDHDYVRLARWRLRLPRLLEPGRMEIVRENGDPGSGTFTFRLTLTHPRLGRLLAQEVRFRDPEPG